MPLSRQQICEFASQKLRAAIPSLPTLRATIGLDGFVDEIVAVVDKRREGGGYDPVRTIADLATKMHNASRQSSNYELVVKQMKLGGNGPIMANALACAGLSVTYIGNIGYPEIHPVFNEFASRAHLIGIAEPGHTDALEFEDGKLMLGKHQSLAEVNWENLVSRVGRERLQELMRGSQLIGMLNWTMLPHMGRIWAKMLDEIVPNLERRSRRLFIDLADPEKRLKSDILDALKMLTQFQDRMDVVLGLNLKESLEIADVLGLPGCTRPEESIEGNAATIRAKLNLACVVIHPRGSAAAATAVESAAFTGPFVQQPRISTGAGDHFNAGFCLAQCLGFGLAESLCSGVATSGYYVRHAASPTAAQLADFIAELPPPQA